MIGLSDNVFVCHSSALLFWHGIKASIAASVPAGTVWIGTEVARPYPTSITPTIPQHVSGVSRRADTIREILGLPEAEPLHVLVGSKGSRSETSNIICHLDSRSIVPRGLCCQVDKQLYVASPEFMFLQMASVLPLYDLIELGYMLCGTYVLDTTTDGFAQCPRIATTQSLASCIEKCEGMHGVKRASRALRYILDGSNSPRETLSAMLLTLPPMLGGFGIKGMQMNVPIQLDNRTVYPDMYIDSKRVAVEYNGYVHYGPGKGTSDDMRYNELEANGVKVYRLTNDHFRASALFDEAGNGIRRLAGMRIRKETAEQMRKRHDLLCYLVGRKHRTAWATLFATGSWTG